MAAQPAPGILHFSGWERVGAVQLPLSVRIDQGKDIFRFRFRTPRLEPPDGAGWRPPEAGG